MCLGGFSVLFKPWPGVTTLISDHQVAILSRILSLQNRKVEKETLKSAFQ